MPIVRQLGESGGLLRRDGALGTDGEVNPSITMRTATDEPSVIPPCANQGIVNGSPVGFETEVDRLHPLPTTGMRAGRLQVYDMRRPLTLLAALSVKDMHRFQFPSRRSR